MLAEYKRLAALCTESVRTKDTGTLQYEIQRQPIVKATNSVGGVRRVIDQLQIEQKKKVW